MILRRADKLRVAGAARAERCQRKNRLWRGEDRGSGVQGVRDDRRARVGEGFTILEKYTFLWIDLSEGARRERMHADSYRANMACKS